MIANIYLLIFLFVFVWLGILSLAFYSILRHYKRLAGGNKGDLKTVLESLLESQNLTMRELKKLSRGIQKMGLIRYNPFSETGGNNSFSLALLDANANGFVLTSLHSRSATRTYAKLIESGKSAQELSNEELKALEIAIKAK